MTAALVLAALAAAPTLVGSWTIDEGAGSDDSCSMEVSYKSGESFRVDWSATEKDGAISMYDNDWVSIVHDKAYAITFDFGDYGTIIDNEASGARFDDTGLRGFAAYFSGTSDLAKIGAAPWVIVRHAGKMIGRFDLKGSRAAVIAVNDCSLRRSGEAPKDPFAP